MGSPISVLRCELQKVQTRGGVTRGGVVGDGRA